MQHERPLMTARNPSPTSDGIAPTCPALIAAAAPIAADDAWRAVLARDRAADGAFVTGVLTTGIYCRPSCAARHPARANVRFFANGADARAAGLRACMRCSPDDIARDEGAVADALTAIRAAVAERLPSPALAVLAARVGYSPSHFQRLFTRAIGLSPAGFARALRLEAAREGLSAVARQGAGRVTDAVYEAGYAAPSRFYESAGGRLGMAPSAWARGGHGVTIRWAVVPTNLGMMLVAATDKGVCRLSFDESEAALQHRFPYAKLVAGDDAFAALLADVVTAVEAPAVPHNIPLDVRGTAFQEAVWRQLRAIPPGETRSYAQIAAAVGSPGAVRATGSANGANHVAVLIPCHRVIRADGTLGGYAWGLGIKARLLDKERDGTPAHTKL